MLLVGDYVTEIKLDTRCGQTRDYFVSYIFILLSVEADAKIDTRMGYKGQSSFSKEETVCGNHGFVNCQCFVVNKFTKALWKWKIEHNIPAPSVIK